MSIVKQPCCELAVFCLFIRADFIKIVLSRGVDKYIFEDEL